MDHKKLVQRLRLLKVKNAEGNALVREAAKAIEHLSAEAAAKDRQLAAALTQLADAAECNTCLHEQSLTACDEGVPGCEVCQVNCPCKECRAGSLWVWSGNEAGGGGNAKA